MDVSKHGGLIKSKVYIGVEQQHGAGLVTHLASFATLTSRPSSQSQTAGLVGLDSIFHIKIESCHSETQTSGAQTLHNPVVQKNE